MRPFSRLVQIGAAQRRIRVPIQARRGAPGARNVVCGTGKEPLIAGNVRAAKVPALVNPAGPNNAAVS